MGRVCVLTSPGCCMKQVSVRDIRVILETLSIELDRLRAKLVTMIRFCSSRYSLQRSCFHGSTTAPKPPFHVRQTPGYGGRKDLLLRMGAASG